MDLSKWSKPNEGWDAGSIEINDLIGNVQLVLKNSVPPILLAVTALWMVKFLFDLIPTGISAFAYFSPGNVELVSTLMMIVSPLGILISGLLGLVAYSLYRPIQLQAFEGKEFVSGVGEAFKLAREAMGKTIVTSLLFGFSVFVGALACVIGALIPLFFFYQAPYLAATTELPPMECMRRSYELNKAYALPVGLAIAVSLIGVGTLSGCGGAIFGFVGGLLMAVFPPLGTLIATIGADFFGALGAFLMLVINGAIFTSIQSVERGVPFKR